jgi:hypothetical protein
MEQRVCPPGTKQNDSNLRMKNSGQRRSGSNSKQLEGVTGSMVVTPVVLQGLTSRKNVRNIVEKKSRGNSSRSKSYGGDLIDFRSLGCIQPSFAKFTSQ